MKKLLYCLAALILYGAIACKKSDDIAPNTPECIKAEIKRLTSPTSSSWPIGRVDEYIFQGKFVYAFEPSKNIADASTTIRDTSCSLVCSVGGFGGPGVLLCNGDKFYEKAVFKRQIWKE